MQTSKHTLAGDDSPAAPRTIWQVTGASVRGAEHVRQERLNQDALAWLPPAGAGDTVALAVADGHGGGRYVRSHLGAAIAARVAIRILHSDLLRLLPQADEADLVQFKRTCEEWLPRVIVRRWRAVVERHLALHPFSNAEMAALPPAPKSKKAPPPHLQAYGTTLLAVLLTPHFHLYLQLGDGDILTVSSQHDVTRPPLGEDDRLLANETTSLCMREAWRSVRLYFQPVVAPPPALILLATDGYANSFVDETAFARVGADLMQTIVEEGLTTVQEQLPHWLQATSESGSGDDITVGLAYRSRSAPNEEQR